MISVILASGGILGSLKSFERKIKKSEQIKISNLTIESLKNTEYHSLFLEKRIKLVDGFYEEPLSAPVVPERRSHCKVEIYDNKLTIGDLNNDKQEDAAVVLNGNCGGSGGFRELAIIINKDGKPFYLTSKELGDRVVINSLYYILNQE